MILSIHQPSYFPWMGLLHKIAQSDQYVLMDEVALSDSAFQHRNLFLNNDGRAKYLTIPFVRSGYQSKAFRDLEFSDPNWPRRHLDFLSNNYRKHPFYKDVMPQIEAVLTAKYERLVDVVVASMMLSFQWFGISTPVIAQSTLEYDRSLRRGELVMALIKACNADVYISGTGAKAYLDESQFGDSVELVYTKFSHPTYSQKGSNEFVAGLACIDIVFNIGERKAAELLNGCAGNR